MPSAPAKKPRFEQVSSRESQERECPPSSRDLVDSVVNTVVTNGKDALSLLFQAAGSPDRIEPPDDETGDDLTEPAAALLGRCPSIHHKPVTLSTISDKAYQTWSASRFVKMGWLVPAEAVTYIDLYVHMNDFCPTSRNTY